MDKFQRWTGLIVTLMVYLTGMILCVFIHYYRPWTVNSIKNDKDIYKKKKYLAAWKNYKNTTQQLNTTKKWALLGTWYLKHRNRSSSLYRKLTQKGQSKSQRDDIPERCHSRKGSPPGAHQLMVLNRYDPEYASPNTCLIWA